LSRQSKIQSSRTLLKSNFCPPLSRLTAVTRSLMSLTALQTQLENHPDLLPSVPNKSFKKFRQDLEAIFTLESTQHSRQCPISEQRRVRTCISLSCLRREVLPVATSWLLGTIELLHIPAQCLVLMLEHQPS
jgi:hypothetical protein